MNRKLIIFIVLTLSGCVTFEDATESAVNAGKHEEKAEAARRSGSEGEARVHESIARDHQRRADKSFLELLLGTIFEEWVKGD